ncbi:MAG: response regulator transcription factor [Chloroflexota bacterium]|nr:response regulator transcription factor [Chloroflexota bacterium]
MTDPRPMILVVDDESSIRSALIDYLRPMGFDVVTAESGETALGLVDQREPDLALLDIVLDSSTSSSRMSGIELCARLRQRPRFIPIIMLTSHEEMEAASLGHGAIAFVTKPWDKHTLATQIRTTLSAVRQIRAEAEQDSQPKRISVGGLQIDTEHLRVSRAGTQIDLTPIEFALLAFLARHPDRGWTREQLLNHVWDTSWIGYERTVDRHIAALRRKLGLERDELIETVHGVGYRLVQAR